MPWPWVSRARYVELVTSSNAQIRVLRDETDVWRATARQSAIDFGALLEKYHALKLAGAAAVAPRPSLPVAARSDVQDAIDIQAGTDLQLARHLQRWAKRQMLDGVPELDVVQQIIHWKGDDDLALDPFAQPHGEHLNS